MKLYCVLYTVGGYAKEDPVIPHVAGIYDDEAVAQKIKSCVSNSYIKEIELNDIAPGYISHLKELFNIDIKEFQKKQAANLRPLSKLDKECLMLEDEFEENVKFGMLTSSDGDGYWATKDSVSTIGCFNTKPPWATHVCWYNN